MSQPKPASTANRSGPEDGQHPEMAQSGQQPPVWFCPSRWLLAHHDLAANISTTSSHMCLIDMNNDGESLLALIDFKQAHKQQTRSDDEPADKPLSSSQSAAVQVSVANAAAPYECRMRVYRGQHLIYNHFLEDMPACLIVTSVSVPPLSRQPLARNRWSQTQSPAPSPSGGPATMEQQPLLTMAIQEDVYFYHKLRPSHKLALEDDESILDSLNTSEVEAWQMVKQDKVDPETMRELLVGLSQELGNHELTSHTQNFIALSSVEQRRQYLASWRLKGLTAGGNNNTDDHSSIGYGEQLMSMDTICCAAARLRYNSTISRSGDYGQSRDKPSLLLDAARWQRLLDIQRDGLVLGTEDRHLLIYELRSIRNRLECHYRLAAAPDHILVERRSVQSLASESKHDLRQLTYKILVSCRNCKIYSLDQLYLNESRRGPKSALKQLIALKSNVLELSWTGLSEPAVQSAPSTATTVAASPASAPHRAHPTRPCFVAACLDRRLYCFGSESGHCKWIVELELPITCVTCLPKLEIGQEETSLIGVASQANRIDFYAASTGRIADSIYFDQQEYPQAMAFGRFGREDNCLCLITNSGRLLVLILKRAAKFAHGQCLSSAASYAASSLAACRQLYRDSTPVTGGGDGDGKPTSTNQNRGAESLSETEQTLRLGPSRVDLPSGFELSNANLNRNETDQMIDSILQSNHNCDQTSLRSKLDAHYQGPRLQIPIKGREFVDQILQQSRESSRTSRVFASRMVKFRDKIKSNLEQGKALLDGSSPASGANGHEQGNRLVLTQVLGLGSVYRVRLALRVNLEKFIGRYHELLPPKSQTDQWTLICFLRPRSCDISKRPCRIRPFRQVIVMGRDETAEYLVRPICEANIEAKLIVLGPLVDPIEGDFVPLDVQIYVHRQSSVSGTMIQRPILHMSINVNLMTS